MDLLPATLAPAGAELMLAGRFGRELLLRTALQDARCAYDYILIDRPPGLGVFTVNALTAADSALAPVQAHVFALKAMPHLEETIRTVRRYAAIVFQTVIPFNVKLAESPAAGQPINIYAADSRGARLSRTGAGGDRSLWRVNGCCRTCCAALLRLRQQRHIRCH